MEVEEGSVGVVFRIPAIGDETLAEVSVGFKSQAFGLASGRELGLQRVTVVIVPKTQRGVLYRTWLLLLPGKELPAETQIGALSQPIPDEGSGRFPLVSRRGGVTVALLVIVGEKVLPPVELSSLFQVPHLGPEGTDRGEELRFHRFRRPPGENVDYPSQSLSSVENRCWTLDNFNTLHVVQGKGVGHRTPEEGHLLRSAIDENGHPPSVLSQASNIDVHAPELSGTVDEDPWQEVEGPYRVRRPKPLKILPGETLHVQGHILGGLGTERGGHDDLFMKFLPFPLLRRQREKDKEYQGECKRDRTTKNHTFLHDNGVLKESPSSLYHP